MSGFWLIGFRAAGKSTLGRKLADTVGAGFLDLDEEFERRQGCSILEYVEQKGIASFREAEVELIREIAHRVEREELIVATGGGCVEQEESRRILSSSRAPKVYLECPAETLWQRLEANPERKKISNLSDFSSMNELLKTRRVFYEKIATFRQPSQDISVCLVALKRLWERR